jgi:hypothetical protein
MEPRRSFTGLYDATARAVASYRNEPAARGAHSFWRPQLNQRYIEGIFYARSPRHRRQVIPATAQ